MTASVADFIQGSSAWHEHRSNHLNASDASAMMGFSKYKTRTQLLMEKSTGTTPKIDDFTQRRFEKGHEYEAIARFWAEEIIGDELFPVVLSDVVDGMQMSASFDGLTMDNDTSFEHKTLNASLEDALSKGVIPEEYQWQMEQGLLLSGASRCLFMASNGVRDAMRYAWYLPRPEIRARLLIGWRQFLQDLDSYIHQEHPEKPVSDLPMALPTLSIRIAGEVHASNLVQYKEAYIERIRAIPTDLQTDNDFAAAENMIKFLDKAEKEIESAKRNALGQTASIDELLSAMDALRTEMRDKRLALNKRVSERKTKIRDEIIAATDNKLKMLLEALNQRIPRAPIVAHHLTILRDAAKNKRTVSSLQDACDDAAAQMRIDYTLEAERIQHKLDIFDEVAKGFEHVFPDLAAIASLDPNTFLSIVNDRIKDAKQAEENRRKAEALKEAQEKALKEAQEKEAPAQAIPSTAIEAVMEPLAKEPPANAKRFSVAIINGKIMFYTPNSFYALTDDEAIEIINALHQAIQDKP